MRPISGRSVSRFASHTLPMNPVAPISRICFPRSDSRTESGAVPLRESKLHDRHFHLRREAVRAGRMASSSTLGVVSRIQDRAAVVRAEFCPSGLVGSKLREKAARPYHRIEQPPGGHAVAEIEPIRKDPLDAQIIRERPHDVVEPWLTSTTSPPAASDLFQLCDAARLQPRLQKILEKFLAQQVEPVAALAAQARCAAGAWRTRGSWRRERAARWPAAPMVPRRVQRPRKLCAFQVKKPTGRTAVRFSRLPSTRQKTGSGTGRGAVIVAAGSASPALSGLDGDMRKGTRTVAPEQS